MGLSAVRFAIPCAITVGQRIARRTADKPIRCKY